ncbi:hypothetical protein [Lactiplantibacillus plantarum]|uniref:hypothetical protein n=2 Tax=Lactiplantibacillus plantarum TaxID=1590 RepID=UPI0010C58170|nr:hypothetical protein [Lactiplantibacillus plantarum]MBF9194220.1 hypothetical protein [Lactiplantibacillus plantarum]MCG0593753.1 hypothetical protein [Lactiplantibacillus plantarum]MCG0623057.1 hypothetical protein [Lactiplantibacillus plantarum]MCG0750044.1 hypothetical protein [Lactiplantibacillus plantarum]MCG0758647.1 hypothetical protein [Lactiplantibacillus plantarum]
MITEKIQYLFPKLSEDSYGPTSVFQIGKQMRIPIYFQAGFFNIKVDRNYTLETQIFNERNEPLVKTKRSLFISTQTAVNEMKVSNEIVKSSKFVFSVNSIIESTLILKSNLNEAYNYCVIINLSLNNQVLDTSKTYFSISPKIGGQQ